LGVTTAVRGERLPIGTGFVDVDGLRVHYERWAPSRASAPEEFLLLHGLGGSTIHWSLAAPLMVARLGAAVTAIDLPGFGLTRATASSATLDRAADLVAALLRRLGPAQLVGNSMGAAIAVAAAAQWPELVPRLTLVTPALPQAPWQDGLHPILPHNWPAAMPGFGPLAVAGYAAATSDKRVVDERLRRSFFDLRRVDGEVRKAMIELVRERRSFPEAPDTYAAATRSLFWYVTDPSGMGRDIARMTPATQIIHGADDRLIPLPLAEAALRQRPDWTLTVLSRCGHLPQLETPERFVDGLAR
jgi:pimeloyl-ACP methyl ester carboxylesterase